MSSSASARILAGLSGVTERVDLVIVGLGITGAGVALDAASRGLSVLAVDAHDVAFGTSRWSSKLIHGGLRYLARGQIRVARESAVERGILLERTAPHLTRPMSNLMPLRDDVPVTNRLLAAAGLVAGDAMRRSVGTSSTLLPSMRAVSRQESLRLAPVLRTSGLRGGLLGWDGQLVDDARLVTCVARTAASMGAEIRTRVRVTAATGRGVSLRDERTGVTQQITARAVVNATGVWADTLVDGIRLTPSRGTHLVFRAANLPNLSTAVVIGIPGSRTRYASVLPQGDGRVYLGLTDEPVAGPVADVPAPTEAEIEFLLGVLNSTLEQPLQRADVAGAYAGLRPLLAARGDTHDLSRRHAVLTSPSGVITVVGGKLTTYRKMAEDAVNAARITAAPCRTRTLPLLGAAPRADLAAIGAPTRLVQRFGAEAPYVLAEARRVSGLPDRELAASSVADVTLAELLFGVTHEGAVDVADLLDRRTRVGLIAADRALAVPLAARALRLATTHDAIARSNA